MTLRRSFPLLVVLSLALATSPAPAVVGDQLILTGPGATTSGYASPVFVVTTGAPLTYVNGDIQVHNVVSDATRPPRSAPHCPLTGPCPLFSSGTEIGLGESAPVLGTEDLSTGTYRFHCTPHPWMIATLVVVDP